MGCARYQHFIYRQISVLDLNSANGPSIHADNELREYQIWTAKSHPEQKPSATADIRWSKRLLAVSTLSIFGLLCVCIVGGYSLYIQNKSIQETLRISQTRADAASKAQAAILIMGKAEAQLVNATDPEEQRADCSACNPDILDARRKHSAPWTKLWPAMRKSKNCRNHCGRLDL